MLDYHGLRGAPATTGQAEIAATYGVHVQSVSNWVATVAAAGAHLPLSPEMATQISRRSRPDEDHRGAEGEPHHVHQPLTTLVSLAQRRRIGALALVEIAEVVG